jgi:hypothetical protein
MVPDVEEQNAGVRSQSTCDAGWKDGRGPGAEVGEPAGEDDGVADAVMDGVGLVGDSVKGRCVGVALGSTSTASGSSSVSQKRTVSAVPMMPAASTAAKICNAARRIVSPVYRSRQLTRPAASCSFA